MRGLTWTFAGGGVARDDLLSSRPRVRVALGAPPLHRRSGALAGESALMIYTTRSAVFVPDGTGLRRLSSPALILLTASAIARWRSSRPPFRG